MLPNVSNVLNSWQVPVKLKVITITTTDFEPTKTIVVSNIKAVVQIATRENLNNDTIDWSKETLFIHSKENIEIGNVIEFNNKDYRVIDRDNYNQYGYRAVIASETKETLLVTS